MRTKRASKTLSLFLAFCMVFSTLLTSAFAETGDVDFGVPLGVSGTITAFAPLDEDVSEQKVEIGTAENELDLPIELTVTVTRTVTTTTGSAITATVSNNDTFTDSEAQEMDPEPSAPTVQTEQRETVLAVSGWDCEPAYDGTIAGTYIFTPVLVLKGGLSMADDIIVPQVTVTVQDAPALLSMSGAAADAFQVEGGATYATLEEAAARVPNNGTITMLRDVTVSKPLLVGNEYGIVLDVNTNYTIDFGGYTLRSGDNSKVRLRLLRISAGSVTLRNGTIRANYDAAQNLRPEAIVVSTTVNIYDMNIISSYAPVLSASNGNITIWSGRFESFGGDLTPLYEELGQIVLGESSTVAPASGWKNNSVVGGVVTVTAAADVTPPSVVSVTPSKWGAAAAVSGNVVITFSEWMDKQTAGTVQLNSLAALTGGVWTNNTTYTIPYSGLENSTTYTVNISGFKDMAGNVMSNVTDGYTFTTLASASSNDLKAALRSTTAAEIIIDSNITLDEAVDIGANHTLTIPDAYTLTMHGKGGIKTSGKTLTINGGGTVTVGRTEGAGLGGAYGSPCEGALNLENITVNLQNTYSGGIRIQTVNVGNGATINLNSATGYYLITLMEGYTLNVNNNGKINIENFKDTGIFNCGGTVHINGGEIAVGAGQGYNEGISNYNIPSGLLKISNGGWLTGTGGGRIRLYAGSKVEGVNGKFKDRGTMFNTDGVSTVAAATSMPSESTLSGGRYTWDGNMFAKEGIIISALPQSATVTQGKITGSLYVTATASNSEEVSYEWGRAEWSDTPGNWDNGTSIPGATSDSYLIPSDLTAGKYGFYVTVSAPGCENVSTKSNMATVTVIQIYTATLNIRMDNTPFTSQMGSYALQLESDETKKITMIGTGCTRTADVENGIWKVYDSSNNYTGVNITVNNAPADATLDYYTVNYSVIKQGTASDGRISLSAVSLGGDSFDNIASGSNFLKGDKATFTVAGAGAESYTYTWSGTHGEDTISGTRSLYKINFVQGKVDVTCTITGSGTSSAPVPGNTGTITVVDITQNSLTLNWANATSTARGSLKYAVFQSASANISTVGECTSHQELLLNASDNINTYTVSGLSPNTTYYFNVIAIDDNMGMAAYTMVSATTTGDDTTPTITITKHPKDVTVTQGSINETLTAEAVASNGKSVRYQWYRFIGGIGGDNVEIITGAISNTFTIPTDLTAGTYKYLCIFNTDGTDYVDSNSAIVTVKLPSGDGSGGGKDNGGTGGGSNTPPPTTIPPQTQPNQPVITTIPVDATIGTNGIANANISTSAVSDAITKAQTAVKVQGSAANGILVELNVTMPQGATSLTATIPRGALQSLVTAGVRQLTVNGTPVSIRLNQDALQTIQSQASSGITISITPANELSALAQSMIGSRPVYNIIISYTDKSGKTQNINSFGSGTATLAIPYTPSIDEAFGYLFGVYVDEKGNASRIPGSVYDRDSRSIIIPTNHLSLYGVGYTAPSAKFTDVAGHWAKESIDYVVGRGLLSGTSEITFAPNTAMTRGMLVTALGRLAEADVNDYTKNSFTDVKIDSPFYPYIEWAYNKGIVQGIGNNQFEPDRAITREEIAMILQNYANTTGYKLPATRSSSAFADASSIGSAYMTSVTTMQQAGIMIGEQNNKFNPKANATRAEVSSMLHRYIKLTIDSATAQGDDGQ